MIKYIVGKNLGHLSRCVGNIEKLNNSEKKKVKVYAYKHSHRWLHANLSGVKIELIDRLSYKKKSKNFLKADVIVHDWRGQVKYIKERRRKEKCIIAGIYHSDMDKYEDETRLTKKFKNQIKDVSQKTTDIFFHINLQQPDEIPKLSTLYVPIPLITREVDMKPSKVKKKLGIKENEPFILVQMGGGVGRYRYKFIEEWYKKINTFHTPYRIVIANQFGGTKIKFRKGIIRAPLFKNGVDLVNAASLVISKPGMGILTDCISTSTPLLSLPADTKERKVKNMMLDNLIDSDICLASKKFSSKDLARRIEEIMYYEDYIQKVFMRIPQNGAEVMAESLKILSKGSRKKLPDLHKKILKLTPFKG